MIVRSDIQNFKFISFVLLCLAFVPLLSVESSSAFYQARESKITGSVLDATTGQPSRAQLQLWKQEEPLKADGTKGILMTPFKGEAVAGPQPRR